MTDNRAVNDDMIQNGYVKDPLYPEVCVTRVRFLNDEIQIEQGFNQGPIDTSDLNNSIVSVSKEQALKIAATINEMFGSK